MDMNNMLVNEAINAMTLVAPRRMIELVQAAIDREVREGDRPAGDQLVLLEFADLLRHMQIRRRYTEEQERQAGNPPLWEQNLDPLKSVKPRLSVVEQRDPGDES